MLSKVIQTVWAEPRVRWPLSCEPDNLKDPELDVRNSESHAAVAGSTAGQTHINTACQGRNLAPVSYIFLYLLFPLGSTWVAAKHTSLLWPLQFPPMGTRDKSDKKKRTCGLPKIPLLLFFFFLFGPLRVITIHWITGSRNNNPQVCLCWKVQWRMVR